MNCKICKQPFSDEVPMSEFATYGGLPAQTCEICFAVNDYTIKDQLQLMVKSISKRSEKGIEIFPVDMEVTE